MTVDWDALRDRVGRVLTRLEHGGERTPDEAQRLMDERARALARTQAVAAEATDQRLDVLIFSLAGERYAIELTCVQAIVPLRTYTPFWKAPEHFFGVTNIRGQIITIVDLRRLLSTGAPGLNDLTRVVALGGHEIELALLADAIEEIGALSAPEILPAPALAQGGGHAYVRGITRQGVAVLDGAGLLGDERLYLDQREEG